MIAIVDYGMCNLDSVKRAVEECGGAGIITSDPRDVETATQIILPGVGAFGDAMKNLRAARLDVAMGEQVIEKQIPFLGICLGMQLMAATGTEHGQHAGLGWIDGEVRRLTPANSSERIPHIGWNEVHYQQDSPLFRGVPDGTDFYFVHSYAVYPTQPNEITGNTPYAGSFVSTVRRDWLFGVQFHPEKSQKMGFRVLRNFLAL